MCHTGFVEIIPNLFIGSKKDLDNSILSKTDILVPLDAYFAKIKFASFNGSVHCVHIPNMSILSTSNALRNAQQIIEFLKAGKKVTIFCLYGHGRTGYFTSMILGLMGYKDPVKFLRKNYCSKAVETPKQLHHVYQVINQ